MANIVQDVKAELLTLRSKVDAAIAQVESGVSNLNEEQVDKLGDLLDEIDAEALDVRIRVGRLLGRVEMAAKVTAAVTGEGDESKSAGAADKPDPPTSDNQASAGLPSADDLDKAAQEQAIAEATSDDAPVNDQEPAA